MAIFGSHATIPWYYNVGEIAFILFCAFIFLKFCGWARNRELSAGAKKGIFILTALGLIAFNALYMQGNSAVEASQGYNMATIAMGSSFAWIFVFAYALMTETRK